MGIQAEKLWKFKTHVTSNQRQIAGTDSRSYSFSDFLDFVLVGVQGYLSGDSDVVVADVQAKRFFCQNFR